jgi:ubiquinone/menaquinone biosynthesis C-methylase UbiE
MFPARFFGMDISEKSIALAAKAAPDIQFVVGDIENSGFADHFFDVVLFSGVLHHFPDFQTCLQEGYRILKKGGCVLSYDPNIRNPVMWLYRHPTSPFFSRQGKTANERLLAAEEIIALMKKTGFKNVRVRGKSGITFKYVAAPLGRFLLPAYNLFEIFLGLTPLSERFGSFLIGYGEK